MKISIPKKSVRDLAQSNGKKPKIIENPKKTEKPKNTEKLKETKSKNPPGTQVPRYTTAKYTEAAPRKTTVRPTPTKKPENRTVKPR